MRLDDQDKAVLRALDDFTISADGETATIEGEMKVTMVRPAADDGARFFTYAPISSGEELEVRIARTQLLEQLGINHE
jgi:hypothetical protein